MIPFSIHQIQPCFYFSFLIFAISVRVETKMEAKYINSHRFQYTAITAIFSESSQT